MPKMKYLMFIFMGTAIFALLDIVFLAFGIGNYGEVAFRSFIVALIGLMISHFLEVKEPMDKSSKSVEDLSNQVNKSVESIEKLSRQAQRLTDAIKIPVFGDLIKEVRRFIDQNRENTVGKLLNQWHEEIAIKELSIEQKRFEVTQQTLALRSYEIFWETLVREQRERAKNGEQPLNILVIHSSSWEIWADEYAVRNNLLKKHKEFCENGGNVTRILCAGGKEPTPNIRKAALNMHEVSVSVLYYDIDSAKVDFGFKWDFLYVRETEVAVIWSSFDPNGVILTSTYQVRNSFEREPLEDLWSRIERNVEDKYKDEAKWWLADGPSTTV